MKIARILLISGSLIILAFTLSLASAHATLVRSDPPAGAVVDRPPGEIFTWFSQALSTGSKLSVFDEQFQSVDDGQTFIDASDATLLRVRLNSLIPGRYTVNWKTSAVDGHVSSGSFDFTVSPPSGPAPWMIAAAAGGIAAVAVLAWGLSRRSRSAKTT
jgi:copper transport protein